MEKLMSSNSLRRGRLSRHSLQGGHGDLWGSPHTTDAPLGDRIYIAINRPALPRPPDRAQRQRKHCTTCWRALGYVVLVLLIIFVSQCILLPSILYFVPSRLLLNVTSTLGPFPTERPPPNPDGETRRCSRGFFYAVQENRCLPSCEEFWSGGVGVGQFSVHRIVMIAVGLLSCIVAIGFIVLAVTILRKAILSFPRIYVLYTCITSFIVGVILLIGNIGGDLFCSSENLIATRAANATAFCSVSGVAFSYSIMQIVLWMVFLSVVLMWGILCPNSYRRSRYAGHLRLFHSLSAAVVLVTPIVTALAQLESGFLGFGVPSLLCLARGRGYVFYTLSFILSLITLIPAVAMVVLGWTILKYPKADNPTGLTRFIQWKTLFLFFYVIVMEMSITYALLYYFIYDDVMSQELARRFSCESNNQGAELRVCPASLTRHTDIFQSVLTTSLVLVMLLPLVILALSVERSGVSPVECCGRSCCQSCSQSQSKQQQQQQQQQQYAYGEQEEGEYENVAVNDNVTFELRSS